MRLIDADLFVAEIKERITNAIQWGKNATKEEIKIRAEQAVATFSEASLTARKMPTVDAEPVVRCKDCKECEERHTANYLPFLYCKLHEHSVSYNAFCCWAERREDVET